MRSPWQLGPVPCRAALQAGRSHLCAHVRRWVDRNYALPRNRTSAISSATLPPASNHGGRCLLSRNVSQGSSITPSLLYAGRLKTRKEMMRVTL